VLTPLPADPLSLVPVLVVASQLLLQPDRAQALATGAVRDYAVPPAAVDIVRHGRPSAARTPARRCACQPSPPR